jgi:glycosyltransferase involved in cell wall biosynthesis
MRAEFDPRAGGAPRGRNVALIANTLWYLHTFRKSTILAMRARGLHVICIGQGDSTAPKLAELGCEVHTLQWQLDSLNPLSELQILLRIALILRRRRPLCAFSFTIKANLLTSLACRALRIPFATNVSGLGTAFLRDGLIYRAVRRLFGVANIGAHTTFFQNSSDRQFFGELGLAMGERTILLPGSGVDTERFGYVAPRPRVRRFLMIARVIRDKGVGEYLAAAENLASHRSDLSFTLLGPCNVENAGAMSVEEIESVVAVTYLGERDDVREAIADCDCLVLPSYREGMPKVVLEAASMGRIAIVTDVPGCRDAVLEGLTGLFCKPRSALDLERAILAAASLEPAAVSLMSRAARARAERDFAEHKSISPYLDIIEELEGAAS